MNFQWKSFIRSMHFVHSILISRDLALSGWIPIYLNSRGRGGRGGKLECKSEQTRILSGRGGQTGIQQVSKREFYLG